MRFIATVAGVRHVVEVDANGHDRRVTLDGRELAVNWRSVGPRDASLESQRADHYSLLAATRSYDAYVRPLHDAGAEGPTRTLEVTVAGRPYTVEVQDARADALASMAAGTHASGDATVRAPMPGLVRSVLVARGDVVERGAVVVVLEAMKMENDLTVVRAGTVKAVAVTAGQTVNQGDALVTIGDAPGADAAQAGEADDSLAS
jgi:biotin carboxyl carrier protein